MNEEKNLVETEQKDFFVQAPESTEPVEHTSPETEEIVKEETAVATEPQAETGEEAKLESEEMPDLMSDFDLDSDLRGFIFDNPLHSDFSFIDPAEAIALDPYGEIAKNKVLDKYEKLQKSGDVLREVIFASGDETGLFNYEGKVKIFCSRSEFVASQNRPFFARGYLRSPVNVVVKDVDRKNGIVYLSRRLAKEKYRPVFIEELKSGIKSRNYKKVKGLVVYVDPYGKFALLDLYGLGVIGRLMAGNFSPNFTRLNEQIIPGDRVEVMVIGLREDFAKPMNAPRRLVFTCSRRSVVEEWNARKWEEISKKLPVDAQVTVRCVAIRSNYFLGEIDGFPDVRAYCFLPRWNSKFDNDKVIIKEGVKYVGYVRKSDEEHHYLRIQTVDYFDIADTGNPRLLKKAMQEGN